jgi:hypothetical protein
LTVQSPEAPIALPPIREVSRLQQIFRNDQIRTKAARKFLDPLRDIYRVAEHGELKTLVVAESACEHDALMDADAEVNRRQASSAAVVVPVRHFGEERHGGAKRV